jgi:hypothetical protein
MKRLIILLILFALLSTSVAAQTTENSGDNDKKLSEKPEIPPDFESDGCTLFPDGNYRDCCVAHDRDYYVGGSCRERRKSDNRLYRCVKKKKGWQNKIIAPIMWIGVRIGGVPFLPTPFRWGFGKDRQKKKEKEKRKKARDNS